MSAPTVQTRAAVRLDADGHMEVDGVALLGNIGRGSYGEVVVGRDARNGDQLVAIKCMSRTQLAKAAAGSGFQKRAPRAAVAESLALSVLGGGCKHVPTLFRTIEDPHIDDIFFVMELADAGACMALHPSGGAFTARCGTRTVESECAPSSDGAGRDPPSPVNLRVFEEADVAHIAADVLAALEAAHSCGFAHRDVSPANILLRSDGTAMLADFGVCASSRVDITKAAEEAAANLDGDEDEDEAAEEAGDASPLPFIARVAIPGGASSGTRKDRFGPFPPKPDNEDDEDSGSLAGEEEEPLWEGWLQKRGRIRKSWQPRYFFVKHKRVYYFKAAPPPGCPLDSLTPQELERAATGSMSLVDVQDVGRCPKPGKPLRFSVTASGRTLFLMPVDHGADAGAQGEVVMQRWMVAFESLREDDGDDDEDEDDDAA